MVSTIVGKYKSTIIIQLWELDQFHLSQPSNSASRLKLLSSVNRDNRHTTKPPTNILRLVLVQPSKLILGWTLFTQCTHIKIVFKETNTPLSSTRAQGRYSDQTPGSRATPPSAELEVAGLLFRSD